MKYNETEALQMAAETAVNARMSGYTEAQVQAEVEEALDDYGVAVNKGNVQKAMELAQQISQEAVA